MNDVHAVNDNENNCLDHTAQLIGSYADTVNRLSEATEISPTFKQAFENLCCALNTEFVKLEATVQAKLRLRGEAPFESYLNNIDCLPYTRPPEKSGQHNCGSKSTGP